MDASESQFAEEGQENVTVDSLVLRSKKTRKEGVTEKTQKMLQKVLAAVQNNEREISELRFKQQMTEREMALRNQQMAAGNNNENAVEGVRAKGGLGETPTPQGKQHATPLADVTNTV